MELNKNLLGTASINPQEFVQAGSVGTWQITYVAGKYGIDDGGQLQFIWYGVSDWELPQFDRPSDFGYTTCVTSGNAKLSIQLSSSCPRPFENGFIITVFDGALKEGESITITLGDKSNGGPGMHSQTYIQSDFHFKVLADPYGTRVFRELPWSQLNLNVVSGPPNEIQVVIPSTATVNEPFCIVVRCLDEWGNPCSNFEGEVDINGVSGFELSEKVKFSSKDSGVKRLEGYSIKKAGTYHVKAKWHDVGLEAISNGCNCKDVNAYNLYWGDMHGQNALAAGVGSMDEYLCFARNPAAVDFCGWQGNDFEISEKNWEIVKERINYFYEPGRFVTFLGYEWSGVNPAGGDHNIYYLNGDGPLYHSHQWIVNMHEGEPGEGTDRYPIDKLWDSFKGRKDVMAIPHVGGRYANFDFYDPEFIKVIEIHSHHGTFEWFAFDALKRGMKVGFIAGSDDHSCRPGLSYPMRAAVEGAGSSFDVKSGYTAAFAKELTRESIWEAITNRRCYATTFARIFLDVRSEGHMMGEEFDTNKLPVLNIHTIGTVPIEYIEIYRGIDVVYRHENIPVMSSKNNIKRIRFVWEGVRVRTRRKLAKWAGSINVDKGFFISAKEYAFDRPDQGITFLSRQEVKWRSTTSGDKDGIVLEISAPEDAKLRFNTETIQFEILNSDITSDPVVIDAGGVNLKVSISEVGELPDDIKKNEVDIKWCDQKPINGLNPYWVKIVQSDGHMAWSSPIFINYKE